MPELAELPVVSKRRAALNNLVFNYTGVAFAAISGLLLVPLYLHYFDLATYGAWLASANFISLLGILECGFSMVFVQRLAAALGKAEIDGFAEVAGSGGILALSLAVLTALVGIGIAPWVPGWVNAEPTQKIVLSRGFVLATLGASFSVLYFTFGAVIQARQRTFFAGVVSIITLVVGLLANIGGLFLGLGVQSIGLGALARGFIGFILLGGYVVYSWRKDALPQPKASKAMLWKLIRTTSPVAVGQSGTIILGSTQAAIVAMLINPAAAAILSITGRAYEVCKAFLAPIGSSVFAGLAHVTGSGDQDKLRRVSREVIGLFAMMTAIGLGLILALNQAFVRNWVGADSWGGNLLSFALCLSAVITSRLILLRIMLTAFGEIKKTAWISLIELLIRLPLIFFLIRLFGLIGMPLAELVSSFFVSGWFFNRLLVRSLDLPRNTGIELVLEGIWPLAATIVLGIIWSLLVPESNGWIYFSIQAFICLGIMCAVVYPLSPATRTTIAGIRTRLTRLIQTHV